MTATQDERPAIDTHRIRWPVEVGIIVGYYLVYSFVRNRFGSASVGNEHAFHNALHVIDLEKALHIFNESTVQSWFLGSHWFVRSLNIFYGSLHFIVTAGVLIWLGVRHAADYRRGRDSILITTTIALVGFAFFPLMPPRLLCDCPYGAGDLLNGQGLPTFVDTLVRDGGLWSFSTSTVQSLSNQYAAMPSLHVAWAVWCALVVVPRAKHRVTRGLGVLYPVATTLAVVVTGNHWWIDAVAGLLLALGGWWLGGWTSALILRRRDLGGSVASS